MKIAIIGAGFSGLACAWHLLQKGHDITVYDEKGIGGGTSSVAAGLMHPYAGLHAKLNRFGYEGMKASLQLMEAVSAEGLVFEKNGLLRVALTDQQKSDYAIAAEKYEDVQKRDNGIFVKSAVVVNCPFYIRSLWQACEKLGARFVQERATVDLDADKVILAVGANKELHKEVINPVKGQILEYEWSGSDLNSPMNSQAYLIQKGGVCIAGATFEKQFVSEAPDVAIARRELEPKIAELCPKVLEGKLVGCRAGVRASTKDHLPLVKQLNDKVWLITGMGSKGLLYHALYAKQLVELVG